MVTLSTDVSVHSFLCCLDEMSCTGCYWGLGDAGLVSSGFLCDFSLLDAL